LLTRILSNTLTAVSVVCMTRGCCRRGSAPKEVKQQVHIAQDSRNNSTTTFVQSWSGRSWLNPGWGPRGPSGPWLHKQAHRKAHAFVRGIMQWAPLISFNNHTMYGLTCSRIMQKNCCMPGGTTGCHPTCSDNRVWESLWPLSTCGPAWPPAWQAALGQLPTYPGPDLRCR